jgi:hypothetical protein
MLKALLLIVAFLLLPLTPSAFAAQSTSFSCEGSLFDPDGSSHSSIDAILTKGSGRSILERAPLTSHRSATIKFSSGSPPRRVLPLHTRPFFDLQIWTSRPPDVLATIGQDKNFWMPHDAQQLAAAVS